jgi:pimeloyl-ACP methyl ester carboxylesterase
MSATGRRILRDDLNLYVEDQGDGAPALVFLHDWGGSGRTWTQVIDALADRFRCITVDLRGWGRSDRHAEDYSLFTQASDTEWVIAALDLKDFVLVGHSMGGKIAQIVAARHPPGLRSLVLVAPAPPTPFLISDDHKRMMLESYASPDGVQRALQILTFRPITDEQSRQLTEDTVGGAQGAKQAWVSQGMALDISDMAAAISCPVGVIVGSADRVQTEAELRGTLLPLMPQARFEILEGVGHLSPLETPVSVAEAISDFLAD